jgi:3alpha(or 20beta)-hydroxysteroid dehydrogenase
MAVESLEGNVALVTGAARGMGAAHARLIVERGGAAMIADVLDTEGEALAEELGERAAFVHLDVSDADAWAAAVATTVARFGALNVLVNNAGITNFGPLGSYDRASWDRTLAINLTGPFLGITAALDALKASAPASVINVASASSLQGQAGLHGYTASKWGLRGFTKSAALELGQYGIRVNAVHPGVVRTPMTEGLDLSAQLGALGRPGEPIDLAKVIAFLASDESAFCTGADFIVDGGTTAGPAPIPGTM